jgi:hypothetical protein
LKNKEVRVLHTVKKEVNILQRIKRKVNWTGHILVGNCLLKHVQGKLEGRSKGKRKIKHKQLLDGRKKRRGCRKLKEEALDRNVRRTDFRGGYGRVITLHDDE